MPGFGSSWGLGSFLPGSIPGTEQSGLGWSGFSMPTWDLPNQMTTLPNASAMMGQIPGQVAKATAGLTPKLGLNFDTANLALSGLSTIGNLWAAFQAQKLAKEQFKYTKGVTDTNLNNQIKTYNTGLVDRANNRAIIEGRDAAYTKNYIDSNSLSRYGKF